MYLHVVVEDGRFLVTEIHVQDGDEAWMKAPSKWGKMFDERLREVEPLAVRLRGRRAVSA
jgi:hypothetical protein